MKLLALALFVSASVCLTSAQAQSTNQTPNNPAPSNSAQNGTAHSVPSIDGGIGDCSATFTVNDANAAPVYDAKISVHIAYGFMYWRKMDLQVGTNVDGKASFTGLPARTKSGLNFTAAKADSTGAAFVDPNSNCKSDLIITLQKKP